MSRLSSTTAEILDFESENERVIDPGTREKIAKTILDHVWGMLQRRHGGSIILGEVVSSVKDRVQRDFSSYYRKKKPARSYIIKVILQPNTNIAMYSNGAEVYVTYARHLTYMERYRDDFLPMPGTSKALAIRRTARDQLATVQKVDVRVVSELVRKNEKIPFRHDAIMIRNAWFAIKPEETAVFITTKNRIHALGGK